MDFLDLDLGGMASAVEAALGVEPEELGKMLERVRKLLHLAEAPSATQGERDGANEKAAALMAKYGITSALLADAGKISENPNETEFEVGSPYCYDKVSLLGTIVRAYGGDLLYRLKDQTHSVLKVYAMPADLTRIEMQWTSLMRQLEHEMALASAARPVGSNKSTFERSFILGFDSVAGRRLRAAEAVAVREADDERGGGLPGTDLVLAKRKDLVTAYIRDKNPKIRKGRARSTQVSAAGLGAGKRAGERASLGRGQLTHE